MGRVVSFRCRCPGAQSVTLAGDFNNWNVSTHPMIYDGIQDVWTITLPLEPGRYEYKCYVDGRRPVYGATEKFQQDPHWCDLVSFYEYIHGDNGARIGASHETGWTGLMAKLMQQCGE